MINSSITVLKFGGTSFVTGSQQASVVKEIQLKHAAGTSLVVVISAMGRQGDPYATDTLLDLINSLPVHPGREIDALSSCGEQISAALLAAMLINADIPAVSLRGYQAGIITEPRYNGASIAEIRPQRIQAHLAAGEVVVVAGYQGLTPSGDISTLGRGGSDTTAIALAGALGAESVEIYTDVDGILTADPKLVPSATSVPEMTYEEASELARNGAVVLHSVASELARSGKVPVTIRQIDSILPGTRLVSSDGRWLPGSQMAPRTTAIASTRGIALISLPVNQAAETGLAREILGVVADHGISLDMIGITPDLLSFTVLLTSVDDISRITAQFDKAATITTPCAKVSLVGGGIHGVPGIMFRIVKALSDKLVTIYQSVDSNTVISVLVDAVDEKKAVSALHNEFFPFPPVE